MPVGSTAAAPPITIRSVRPLSSPEFLYTVSLLDGGLRLIQTPMPGTRSVTIALFLGVGSRHESDRFAGISHLTEHMLFKGTERRPRMGEISGAIDEIGGLQNASTDKETTVYWVKVAAEHGDLGVELLSDMVRHSLIRPRDVRTEKKVIVEELNALADEPQDWIHVLSDEALWPDHPLGREIAGTHASVQRLGASEVRAHLDTYYGPNNAVLSIAGAIDARRTESSVRKYFGDWQPVTAPQPEPAPMGCVGARFRGQSRATEQVNLCVAFPAVARRDPDRWPIEVLLTVLGGSGSSRLFQSLREKRGLAYETHAYSMSFTDTGSIILYIGTDPKNARNALAGMMKEVRRVVLRGITAAELRKAKQYYAGRLWLGLEDSSSVASWFGGQEILHHEVVSPAQAIQAVEHVTLEDVRRVARSYLRPEAARLAAVGPDVDSTLLEYLS